MCIITSIALGVSAIATAIGASAAATATAAGTAAATAFALAPALGGVGAGFAAAGAAAASTAATAATVASVAGTVATVAGVVEIGGLVVAGGIVGTVGAVQAAEEDKAMADFQAEQAAENMRLSFREAEAIGIQGNQKLKQMRLEMLSQKSAVRTGFAASGVVLGAGTTADYEADIADAYDSDSRNLKFDIATQKWVKQVEGTNYADQGTMFRTRSKAASRGRTTSLLSGIFKTLGDTASAGSSAYNSIGKLTKAGA